MQRNLAGVIATMLLSSLCIRSLFSQQTPAVSPNVLAWQSLMVKFCYNAGMIIFLVPIVGALTTRCAHFDMIHLGSYLSALSPLWIVAFPGHGRLTHCMPLLVIV